jgi:hypothetical protein
MKSFNVHFNKARPGKLDAWFKRRGFTAVVSCKDNNDPWCYVSVAWCSGKDEYNKKVGLSTAALAPSRVVHKKHLPSYLLDLEAKCMRGGFPLHPNGHYNYLLKNFIS